MLNIKCPNNILIDNPTCIDTDSVSIQDVGHIVIASCTFSSNRFNNDQFNTLEIPLPCSLDNAVAKRKSEFLAGRYLAKIAMKHLGVEGLNIPIDEHKAPAWPAGLLGSISHSKNTALCVITKSQNHNFIGIDIEHWLSTSDANSLVNNIVVDQSEYQIMLPHISFEQAITLIFSAKESLYKAIFKAFSHYVDFDVAMVTELDFTTKQLTLTLCQNLSEAMHIGRQFICQFKLSEQLVTTLISD
ncbi:4'-phosphopantetheinyl transferase superfamily protein [Psychromonas sp. 14N.309.X.WAT.B.A12]|uniref:4'-phosphopantetheinyl transferase family protein n=1 Tax=Psychromonas sp. 14N.309.X.WAT.B.A12 TaxID=2998322 RepID=UPI0025B0FCD1|nr:4'-phosphopantetheinyl transferase superfamily protein [Psychromonas sp. 14N.309.X.WAT.B.A12]MDN2662332.1 4'-phosphopantetheinyl transferase superfamily protein [Psychromonas sp. 14N.309.X.WAT.B.A12]